MSDGSFVPWNGARGSVESLLVIAGMAPPDHITTMVQEALDAARDWQDDE